jgi:hypothetical protein
MTAALRVSATSSSPSSEIAVGRQGCQPRRSAQPSQPGRSNHQINDPPDQPSASAHLPASPRRLRRQPAGSQCHRPISARRTVRSAARSRGHCNARSRSWTVAGRRGGQSTLEQWLRTGVRNLRRVAPSYSRYNLGWYGVHQDAWEGGDRSIQCMVSDSRGKTTGTLRGAHS